MTLLRRVGGSAETARELVHRLYVLCVTASQWASEALAYNAPVVPRPEIVRLAALAPVRSNDRPFEPDGGS